MEIIYLFLGIILGGILAFVIVRSNSVSKKIFNDINEKIIRSEESERNFLLKIEELKSANLTYIPQTPSKPRCKSIPTYLQGV